MDDDADPDSEAVDGVCVGESPAQREISLQPTILPARLICQNYFIHTRWWEVDNIIIILQWFVIHLFELRESH